VSGPSGYERVGLRYVDEVRVPVEGKTDWADWVHPSLLGARPDEGVGLPLSDWRGVSRFGPSDVPVLTDVPITPRYLWTDVDRGMFFEYELGNLKPEDALDSLDPNWRNLYRDDGFEMFAGDDGNLGIRMKNR
jgi:hypothetical protein